MNSRPEGEVCCGQKSYNERYCQTFVDKYRDGVKSFRRKGRRERTAPRRDQAACIANGLQLSLPSEQEKLLKNYNIGIVVASNYMQEGAYPFYFKMYQSIVRYLSTHKYSGILELITPLMRERKILPNIASGKKVDGIIVMGQLNGEYLNF